MQLLYALHFVIKYNIIKVRKLRYFSHITEYITYIYIYLFLLRLGIKQSYRSIIRLKYKRPFSIDYRERGIPCTRCVSQTGYLAHRKSKGEIKGISKPQNLSIRLV